MESYTICILLYLVSFDEQHYLCNSLVLHGTVICAFSLIYSLLYNIGLNINLLIHFTADEHFVSRRWLAQIMLLSTWLYLSFSGYLSKVLLQVLGPIYIYVHRDLVDAAIIFKHDFPSLHPSNSEFRCHPYSDTWYCQSF